MMMILIIIIKILKPGDSSTVKHTWCFCKRPRFKFPSSTQWLKTIHNSSSWGSAAFFWPPQAPGTPLQSCLWLGRRLSQSCLLLKHKGPSQCLPPHTLTCVYAINHSVCKFTHMSEHTVKHWVLKEIMFTLFLLSHSFDFKLMFSFIYTWACLCSQSTRGGQGTAWGSRVSPFSLWVQG